LWAFEPIPQHGKDFVQVESGCTNILATCHLHMRPLSPCSPDLPLSDIELILDAPEKFLVIYYSAH
jgi:hypothetical protein